MNDRDPLRFSFRVECSPEHAFTTWTDRIDRWWPKGHAMSGDRGMNIRFEPHVGGRLVERSASGDEFTWGTVLAWDPPSLLRYTWLAGGPDSEPTEVMVSFTAGHDGGCDVDIVHTGWDLVRTDAAGRRQANVHGWSALVDAFNGPDGWRRGVE